MRNQKGFTLVELMVVVAIIGILAAIGIPSYQEYIAKARRADAQKAVMDATQYMRRFYSSMDTYQNNNALPVLPNNIATSAEGYTVSVTAATDTTFTIRATRDNPGVMSQDPCGNLEVNERGVSSFQANTATGGRTVVSCFKGG